GFCDFHDDSLLALAARRGTSCCFFHSRYRARPTSNSLVDIGQARHRLISPAAVVRAEGLEPPRLSSREPKSRASTSSATPANGTLGTCVGAGRRGLYTTRTRRARQK